MGKKCVAKMTASSSRISSRSALSSRTNFPPSRETCIAWSADNTNKALTRGSSMQMQYTMGGTLWGDDAEVSREPAEGHHVYAYNVRNGLYLNRESDIKCTAEAIRRARDKFVLRSPAELQALRVQSELVKSRPFKQAVRKRGKSATTKPSVTYKPEAVDLGMRFMLGGEMDKPAAEDKLKEEESKLLEQYGYSCSPTTSRSTSSNLSTATRVLQQRKRNLSRCSTAPTHRSPSKMASRADLVASRAEDLLDSVQQHSRLGGGTYTSRSGLSDVSRTPGLPRRKKMGKKVNPKVLSLAKYLLG